jgi:hypothetical protein
MKNKINLQSGILIGMVLLAAFSRLLPHPPNFTPIGGMALFGAAYFSKRYLGILIPLAALWISDVVLNNTVYAAWYDGFSWFGVPAVYLGIIAIALMGSKVIKKVKPTNLLIASLLASTIFFLISNLGSWWMMPTYTKDFSGVLAAYVAGLPFFLNTIAGDLFFTALLFGSYELIKQRNPSFA